MDTSLQPDAHVYAQTDHSKNCDPALKSGGAGKTNGEQTEKGIRYNVRAPSNYDGARPHALIMVYAPSGFSATQTESMMAFTRQATRAGYLLAYADHAKLGLASARELTTIPGRLSQKWCVDSTRIFLTGHSDGGTISHISALLPQSRAIVRAIAPSAAGIVPQSLQPYGCRRPLPVMIMHSRNDKHFIGYGAKTAKWWAQCNGCDVNGTLPLPNGCSAFQGCALNAPTWYCEGEGSHSEWPERNATMIEFFAQQMNQP